MIMHSHTCSYVNIIDLYDNLKLFDIVRHIASKFKEKIKLDS